MRRQQRTVNVTIAALVAVMLSTISGCGSAPKREPSIQRAPQVSKAPAQAPAPRATRGGGYYLDDGPGDTPPPDLERIPEPVPQVEPLHRGAMRPYVVLGQSFTPMTELMPYKARGVATWYGRRYHGKQTSTGEVYDMYAISAAHPTLPLPSYARVTSLETGKSVVVRINDRGPFIGNRLIDLSYTAAHRLGVISGGSAWVEVETIIPAESGTGTRIAVAPRAPNAPGIAQSSSAATSARVPAPTTTTKIPQPSEADPMLSMATAAPEPLSTTITAEAHAIAAQPLPEATPPATPTAATGGIYLQLAAFGSRENAEGYLARAKGQIEWLAQRLHVVTRDGLYRVHAGPYASPGEARLAAERIAVALGARPIIVSR